MSQHLRFRQVHLDFHTSPAISGIGEKFDAEKYVARLKAAHVDSVTTFATCHHGWAYYNSKVVDRHPHLKFNLLREQFDACKAAGINVPIYITAGVNNRAAELHPEWREISPDGGYNGWQSNPLKAGFHKMCFNTPYLDHLCEVIKEVVTEFPNCDGIFLDIISQGQCCCKWCLEGMHEHGLDPTKEEDRLYYSQEVVLEEYYRRTTEAARHQDPGMNVFHNSGHIEIGKTRRLTSYFSHLELESLPTGGWGYDHFPMSAKYVSQLPHDFLGMTGKFHTSWGEFGGFKHPNALRYECAAMLAFGSKCSVGDQLHPAGALDEGTYDVIGAAYSEVEKKEPWCDHVKGVADVAILSTIATNQGVGPQERGNAGDTGAGRILLESHVLFDMIDTEMDFSPYKVIILPDSNHLNEEVTAKLSTYLQNGGKLFLTGKSGLNQTQNGFLFDIGAEYEGESPFNPDYINPADELKPAVTSTPFVSYVKSERIKVTDGQSLGDIHDPWFNRTYRHFCSHQHAPYRLEPSGYAAGVFKGNILYLATPIFSLYRGYGAVVHKQFFQKCLSLLLDGSHTVETNMPSTARVNLTQQESENRYVLHLLYANTIARGGGFSYVLGDGDVIGSDIQVIEDLVPLANTTVRLRLPQEIKKVTFEPQGKEVSCHKTSDGRLEINVDQFTCHQMVVLHY